MSSDLQISLVAVAAGLSCALIGVFLVLRRMAMMADAISRAGSTDGEKIRDALAATKNFPGASGTITIDENRNAQKPIVILQIVPGSAPAQRTKFVTSIKP